MTKTAKSKRELARLLGKSEATVRKWVKDDRWTLGKGGPWDVEEAREWSVRTLAPDLAHPAPSAVPRPCEDGAGGDDPGGGFTSAEERRVNIELKRSRKAAIDHELEVKRAKYVLKTDVQQAWMRIAHEVKTELLNIPDAAVPAMQGLSEAEQRDVLRGRILEVLRLLSGEDTAVQ